MWHPFSFMGKPVFKTDTFFKGSIHWGLLHTFAHLTDEYGLNICIYLYIYVYNMIIYIYVCIDICTYISLFIRYIDSRHSMYWEIVVQIQYTHKHIYNHIQTILYAVTAQDLSPSIPFKWPWLHGVMISHWNIFFELVTTW